MLTMRQGLRESYGWSEMAEVSGNGILMGSKESAEMRCLLI